jgi:hypothetical protein
LRLNAGHPQQTGDELEARSLVTWRVRGIEAEKGAQEFNGTRGGVQAVGSFTRLNAGREVRFWSHVST